MSFNVHVKRGSNHSVKKWPWLYDFSYKTKPEGIKKKYLQISNIMVHKGAEWYVSWLFCGSYLLLSFRVLQLISSMYTISRGTVCGQQGSGSSWVEYLWKITTSVKTCTHTDTMTCLTPCADFLYDPFVLFALLFYVHWMYVSSIVSVWDVDKLIFIIACFMNRTIK